LKIGSTAPVMSRAFFVRCDAETSPGRAIYYHPSRHCAGQPIVAGWAYHWIAQLRREFRHRREHKPPLGKARMRNR